MDFKEKTEENKKLKLFYVLLIIFLTIFIDQLTKIIISKKLYLYQSIQVIKNFLYITYIENRGFLMGLGGNLNDGTTFNGVVIITIIAITILLIYFIYIWKKNIINNYLLINFSLLIGGAFGNFIDRLFRKRVIDFIEIKVPQFRIRGFYYNSFPIFNFADLFVSVGIIMLLIYYIFLESKYEKKEIINKEDQNEIKNENENEFKNIIANKEGEIKYNVDFEKSKDNINPEEEDNNV